jgi:hypothetical protein
MMTRTRSLQMFIAVALALNASPAFAGITIGFTTPAANSSYAVGSPIG